MVSSGFVNGDYLIRNADWLAKGNPLGVKLHVPLARTLSGLAKVLAEGYASVLGVRKLDTIVVRVIGERMWFLGLTTQLACLSDCILLFTSHAAALHVYSSLLVFAQITFGKFCYEAGFGGVGRQKKRRKSTESLVFGVLFVPPIFLFFPTTFAYFASYLVLHAVALLVRAVLCVFVYSTFDDDDDFFDVVYEKILVRKKDNNNNIYPLYTLSLIKKKKKRGTSIINKITKDFVNALRSFGRLPVAL
jgi:glucose dehydrogenase